MTLSISDMLSDQYEFCYLIPSEGMLSEELNRRNIPFVLMGDQSLPPGVKGKRVAFRYAWLSIKNILKSIGVIRKYKPDILYCPGPAALPWSAFCGQLTRKPVVWHLHHIFLDGTTRKLLNLCGRWKAVKKVLAVSNCVGNQLYNEIAHQKTVVLYNPVDYEKYSSGNSEKIKNEIEDILNQTCADTKCIIGHVALIQRSKRQDFVLDVLAKLSQSGANPIGVFAGEVREQEYYDELIEKVKMLNLEHQVVFLGRRNDIPDLLQFFSVLIIPSTEGFPLAGLEASSSGTPVVACNVAGAEEFVQVSGGGLCFKENDEVDAMRTIIAAINQNETIVESGKAFSFRCNENEYKNRIVDVFETVTRRQ